MPASAKKINGFYFMPPSLSAWIGQTIGADNPLALALMDMGALHSAKKRSEKAQECILEAIQIFEQCEAEVYLKQAKETLESLQ